MRYYLKPSYLLDPAFHPGYRCADGYYGNPTVPGGTCVPCNCSGNVDPLEAGHCDSVTGECLKCLWNTDGAHCERCADGFYGDAVTAKNCRGECVSNEVIAVIYCHTNRLTLAKGTQPGGDLSVSCVLTVGFQLDRCRSHTQFLFLHSSVI